MNHYAEAISIFDGLETDERKHELVLEILRSNPGAIIKASRRLEKSIAISKLQPFERRVIEIAKTSKIKAIKHYRSIVKIGLKECKERVEYLMSL